jgi:EmrB/QacA subfamily drug resistance transporter
LNNQMHPIRQQPHRLMLPVLFAPIFMVILDVFIVNVAAPSLQGDLGASQSAIQWVVAAYLLTYSIALITGGRLGDVIGRRRMFRIGVAGFTVASALCAAAPTPSTLIAARLLQGLTGAAMWPQVLSVIQVEFPVEERPRAFAAQGLVQGMAAIAGQIVGGGLIALDLWGLGWRWVFLVNIPVGLLAFVVSRSVLPESRSETARRLDLTGMGLATMVLTLVLVPTIEGREWGWPIWGFVALAAAIPALALFLGTERRIARRGGAPLADLSLFETRTFRMGLLAAIVLYQVISFFLLLAVYLQDGLGLSAMDSGLVFTPIAVGFVGGSLIGPRLADGVRRLMPQIGAMTAAAGLLLTVLVIQAGVHSVSALLILAMVPVGAGMGLAVPTLIALVLSSVPQSEAGTGSGMLVTAQQVGNAIGVAVIGSLFFGVLGSRNSAEAYGDALSLSMAVQAACAVGAAVLLTRAHEHAGEALPAPQRS